VNNVVSLRAYTRSAILQTLVLVDLQQDHVATSRLLSAPNAADVLSNCRSALAHARVHGLPVAFVRWARSAPLSSQSLPPLGWIEGFEPKRSDMVFERSRPSCYSSRAFAEVMENEPGNFVLAGFAGESACLATAVEAFHRGHQFTFLSDASMSHALGDISASDTHRTVTRIIGTYGDVTKTRTWIAATSYRVRSLGTKNESGHGRTA
jgi:nicotinamidase-related amidase